MKTDKELIKKFEEKIKEAFEYKYKELLKEPEKIVQTMLKDSPIFKINLLDFLKIYRNSSFYSKENEDKIIKTLMDIKFQVFCILEVETGQYNWRVVDLVGSFEEIPKNDFIFLTKLNIDQNMIYKVRVLWERIMNLVYLIVNKKDLEESSFNCPEDKQCPYIKGTRVYRKKSKKAEFKKFLEKSKEWGFMRRIMKKIDSFDNFFRTAETHKNSTLRRYFLEVKNVKTEEYCFDLLSIFMNETYPNILKMLKDEKPTVKFWRKMPIFPLDKQYLSKFNEKPPSI